MTPKTLAALGRLVKTWEALDPNATQRWAHVCSQILVTPAATIARQTTALRAEHPAGYRRLEPRIAEIMDEIDAADIAAGAFASQVASATFWLGYYGSHGHAKSAH